MAQGSDVEAMVAAMTLREKVGQMTQPEVHSVSCEEAVQWCIGSVLSGGGGRPKGGNSAEHWQEMVLSYTTADVRCGGMPVRVLYGVDAVHGHNNVADAVIFPHNIALGATNDEALVERIGRAVSESISATGILWNFAPCVTVPQDFRWGRTYEGFGADAALVGRLGAAFVRGLEEPPHAVLSCTKHFVGDGGTSFGYPIVEGMAKEMRVWHPDGIGLDRGNTVCSEEVLREVHLPPYKDALAAGTSTIMASYSSWNGEKMHGQRYLLTDVLKRELGFQGFVVSDWQGIDEIEPDDHYQSVVRGINAGVDMVMVPYDFKRFINTLVRAVEQGDVPMSRIDDAVGRILRAKAKLGLVGNGALEVKRCENANRVVDSVEHRVLAREAVAKSLVALRGSSVLPLARHQDVFVAGIAAADVGLQCGGWTIEWQGGTGAITSGTTLVDALSELCTVTFCPSATNSQEVAAALHGAQARVGILVLSEPPYAEGTGDRHELHIGTEELEAYQSIRSVVETMVVIVYSGRPLQLPHEMTSDSDAIFAAWLPGSEAGPGICDVLFGDVPLSGACSFEWCL